MSQNSGGAEKRPRSPEAVCIPDPKRDCDPTYAEALASEGNQAADSVMEAITGPSTTMEDFRRNVIKLKGIVRSMDKYIREQKNVHTQIKCRIPELLSIIDSMDEQLDSGANICCCATRTVVATREVAMSPGHARAKKANSRAVVDDAAPELPARVRRSLSHAENAVEGLKRVVARSLTASAGRVGRNGATVRPAGARASHDAPAPARLAATTATRARPSKLRPKNDAVIVHLDSGEEGATCPSYADTLKALREKINPNEMGYDIMSIRKTRAGDALIQLKNGSKNPGDLAAAINETLGAGVRAKGLVPMDTVTITDIEEGLEGDEVITAICNNLTDEQLRKEEVLLRYLKAGKWGTQLAIVSMPAKACADLLRLGKLKIGWTNCRVQRKANIERCFRCHGTGHKARECSGPDRSDACRRCGETGHRAAGCNKEKRCLVCADRGSDPNHTMGTKECPIFRASSSTAKRASK